MRKKVYAIALSVVLLFTSFPSAMAITSYSDLKQNLIKAEVAKLNEDVIIKAKQLISEMDDEQFSSFIAEYVSSSEKEFGIVKEELKLLGVELEGDNNSIKTDSIHPRDVDFSVYTFKRSGQSQRYIQALLEFNKKPYYPGTYDLLSVEWDSSMASYWASTCSGEIDKHDSSKRNQGIVIFYVMDRFIKSGDYVYATVQVIGEDTGWLDYSSRYAHTFATTDVERSHATEFSYTPNELPSIKYSFKLNLRSDEDSWYIDRDNSVKI